MLAISSDLWYLFVSHGGGAYEIGDTRGTVSSVLCAAGTVSGKDGDRSLPRGAFKDAGSIGAQTASGAAGRGGLHSGRRHAGELYCRVQAGVVTERGIEYGHERAPCFRIGKTGRERSVLNRERGSDNERFDSIDAS